MKNWKKKGTQDLLESIISLSGESIDMVSHQISAMLGVFCFGSQQYVEYTRITLPYVLEHKQISRELYDKIMDAVDPVPEHIAASYGGDGVFRINEDVFAFLRKRAKKASENGECSPGINKKFKWTIDMLSEVTFSRRYLKLPVNLVFSNETGSDRIVSMFQPVERSNKPITITDPVTKRVEVIRKPFIDNTEIRKVLWRLLSIGILDVDSDGYMFLTKLGTEIAALYLIGMGKNDLKAEEWVYIYSPFLVSKLFEAHFRCLQIRRILFILNELDDRGTIFDIMLRYGAEGDIENPVWPEWSIPEILHKFKGKLDWKAKDYLYSYMAWDVQGFLDTCIRFGWIKEDRTELFHRRGAEEFKAEVPLYILTPAGRLALDVSDRGPKTLVCLEQNIKYPFSGYIQYRRIVVLTAIINGHDNCREIQTFASDLGVFEEETIIEDVIDDLVRIGFNIQRKDSKRGEVYSIPSDMNVSYTSSLRDMRVEKPEFFKQKDADRLRFPMIGRRHLLLCDLADRKKIITRSRKNQVDLFRAWFADMLKSVGVNCETFGGKEGPDVVVDNKGYVVYVSVEGAFDDDPELGIEKMVSELKDKDRGFRSFLSPKSRRLKPYYAYLVRNEETFQAKDEMLKEIAEATGNDRGQVLDFREMLSVFNEFAASVEKGSLTDIMGVLFPEK